MALKVERLIQYDAFALPLRDIYYDAEFNCRGWFPPQSVSDLAENIRLRGGGIELRGLDYPVAVQPIADMAGQKPAGFSYRLIAGHRRFKAIEVFLKWTRIPAMIRAGLSDHEARMLNFVENLERKDLNILEEARGLQHLYPSGVTVRSAAAELKRPTAWVHDRLRLLTLPEEVQQLAATGLLGAVNIKVLIALATPEEQIAAAHKIVDVEAGTRQDRFPPSPGPKVSPEVRLPQVEGCDQSDGSQDAWVWHHRPRAADGGLVRRLPQRRGNRRRHRRSRSNFGRKR